MQLIVNGFYYESDSIKELFEFLIEDYPNMLYGITEYSLYDAVKILTKLGHKVEVKFK